MKDLGLSITAPICLIIFFCGLAVMLGSDVWVTLKVVAVCLPIAAYVVFSIFTVCWAIKTGEIGIN
jgi:hypothetical protein